MYKIMEDGRHDAHRKHTHTSPKNTRLNLLLDLPLGGLGMQRGKVRDDLVDALATRPAHEPRQLSDQTVGHRLGLPVGPRARAPAELSDVALKKITSSH